MKAYWLRLAARIDALQPRERVLVFGALLVVLVFVANALVLAPLGRREAALRARIEQQRTNVAGIDSDVAARARAFENDPNVALKKRLDAARTETARMSEELRTMQKGLVPPERIAPLLETILRANGRLKLVALKTLSDDALDGTPPAAAAPPSAMAGTVAPQLAALATAAVPQAAAPASATPARPAAKTPDMLYRHGVELTVRGNYLDMVDYMNALESLPTQLFWGRARLDVEDYPNARLTLTLYTLSLDPKWMKL